MAPISRPAEADLAIVYAGIDPALLVHKPKPGPPRRMSSFVGGGVVLTVASDAAGRRLVALELQGRAWAAGIGLKGPEVLASASDGAWMLARWVDAGEPSGAAYVKAALSAADTIMAAQTPEFDVASTQWKADPSDRWQRVARLAAGRFPLSQWRAAKARAGALTQIQNAHGDFYFRNVMWTGDSVAIIDWEFVSQAPAYTDHLRLWSTLHDPADRDLALRIILAGADESKWRHVCLLGRWLSLRLLAENLSAPPAQRNPKDLAHARLIAREGKSLAALTDSPGTLPTT